MGKIRLTDRIVEGLKNEIKVQPLLPGERIPPFMKIAERYEVSYSTVKEAVKKLVNEGFLETIQGRGTFIKRDEKDIHSFSRGLFDKVISKDMVNQTYTIGYFLWEEHIKTGLYWIGELLKGVIEYLSLNNINFMLIPIPTGANESEFCIDKIKNFNINGVIFSNLVCLEQILEFVIKEKFPYVIMDVSSAKYDFSKNPDSYFVLVDERKGMENAVSYLVELGHKRIGLLYSDYNIPQQAKQILLLYDKVKGYKDGLSAKEIEYSDELMVYVSIDSFGSSDTYKVTKNLLSIFNLPTALISCADNLVFQAMETIKDTGFKIPEDISLISFDNTPLAVQADPPLTSISKPFYEIGKSSAEILVNQIMKKEKFPKQKIFQTDFIIRNSCAKR